MKNNVALFYTCSLIEYIGRKQKLRRGDVVAALGRDMIKRIYDYSDVFHCDLIEKVADEFIELCNIPKGDFDNVAKCRYEVPDYWTIGEVYERLIADASPNLTEAESGAVVDNLILVYASWISDAISNYNSDFFYQPRDYIRVCYEEGEVCP